MTDNATSLAAALTSASGQRDRRYRNESNVKVHLSQLIGVLGYGPVEAELETAPGRDQAEPVQGRNALANDGIHAERDECTRQLTPLTPDQATERAK